MLVAGLMVACNVGVTKTPLGSTLVVTEMVGFALFFPRGAPSALGAALRRSTMRPRPIDLAMPPAPEATTR